MVQLVRTSAHFSSPSSPALSPGTISDPSIANYQANNGPEPAFTNWGALNQGL